MPDDRTTLSPEQVGAQLEQLPGWACRDGALERTFTFPSFPDAVAFVTRLAFEAEAADHHPDLHISFRRVTVRWSTHSAGGVTRKDFSGARQSDTIARG